MSDEQTLLDVTIPSLPPTVNHVYRTSRSSFRYKTPEGKAWQAEAIFTIMDAIRERKDLPYCGGVKMSIVFSFTNRLRWDVDNRIKTLQDCLAPAGVIKNDTQVVELHARREHGNEEYTRLCLETTEGD